MDFTFLDYLIMAFGAYYIIGIGVFQIGLKGPLENRLQRRVGNKLARVIYSLIGLAGIVLVVTGII